MAVEAIVEKLVSLVADAIDGQLRAAWGLEHNLKKLKALLLEIQSVLADAEEKQTVKPAVKSWLDALKKVAYEAEDVLDELNYETLCHKAAEMALAIDNKTPCSGKVRDFFSSHNPSLIRLKMGRKVSNLLEEINEIAAESAKFNFIKASVAQPETADPVNETCSFVEESEVVGRRGEKDEMVELLLGQVNHDAGNVAVLPIFGMGGLGKTTLAQFIYNDQRVVDRFELRAWVCVSDPWDVKRIIQEILKLATENKRFESPSMEELHVAFTKALTRKRFLIVLDDVWEEDSSKWDTLKGLMNCGGKGSAVIVTTRSQIVSQITGTLRSYSPRYLSDDESQDLLCKRAFAPPAEKTEELVKIGKDIANKCRGLPLALKIMGSLLHTKRDRNQWLDIKHSDIWNTDNDILPILRLSYKHLPRHSKPCFTFCAIFPKDYEMDKEMLINMWMAHGFIPSHDRRLELEIKGNEIFNQLVQRSFLQDVKETKVVEGFCTVTRTTCKMHDLIHDLALSIMGNDCVVVQEKSTKVAVTKDAYHLSLSDVLDLDIEHMLKASPCLRTILWASTFKDFKWERELRKINMNVSGSTSLRVLLMPQARSLRLPHSMKPLQHLRYLQLWSDELRELPESICTLLNLQKLDLSGCKNLRRLPKRTSCMISLKHLYLDRCHSLEEMPRGMGRLTNLQTLTMYVVGKESAGRGIGELKELHLSSRLMLKNLGYMEDAKEAREVLHSKDLNQLALRWSGGEINSAEQVLEELKPPACLKFLKIWYYEGSKLEPTWMAQPDSLPNLEELQLLSCPRPKTFSLGGLTALRRLLIYYCHEPTSLLEGVVLPTLQELVVGHCRRLTSLALGGLTALRNLTLLECDALTSLLPEGVALPALQELKVSGCPQLENIDLNLLRTGTSASSKCNIEGQPAIFLLNSSPFFFINIKFRHIFCQVNNRVLDFFLFFFLFLTQTVNLLFFFSITRLCCPSILWNISR